MALVVLSLAWVAGLWLGSVLAPSGWWLVALIVPAGFALVGARTRRAGILGALAVVIAFGASFYYQSSLPVLDEDHVVAYLDESHTISGTVSRMPEEKEKAQALRLTDVVLGTNDVALSVAGAVLVYVPPFPEYEYGQRLTLTGRLTEPAVFETFDWKAYLARDDVFATVFYPEVLAVEPGHGIPILSAIDRSRLSLAEGLAQVLPEPQASLAQGLTLGLRSGIPDDVRQKFADSGTAHLLAISGLHLGIVAGAILLVVRGLLGRRGYWYVWLALAGIWFFVILSGLAPPVVRGAVMSSVFLTAELFGRQKAALPALCLAAAVMASANPQILWSASFQMSFGAMAGLIFLLPGMEHLTRRLVGRFPGSQSRFYQPAYYIGAGLAVTTAAVVGVAPLIAYYFGALATAGGIATLAAMPVVPLIIFGALTTGALALASPVLAVPTAALTWAGLTYLVGVVDWFARWPLPEFGVFDAGFIWLFYGLLGLGAWRLNRWYRRQAELEPPVTRTGFRWKPAVISLLLIVAVISAGLFAPAGDRLKVVFLDVGQGDAVYIRTPYGQDILIDGGPSPQRLAQELGRQMPFWNRTIELVVLTHGDADHLTGLVEALGRYQVGQVVYPGADASTQLYGEWRELLHEKQVPYTPVVAGQAIKLAGNLQLNVANPLGAGDGEANDMSVVLSLNYGDITFLFTGDLPLSGENELIYRRLLPDVTVLKVAHHGSSSSTGTPLLSVTRPEMAVIQVGRNSYGHPTAGVLTALGTTVIDGGVYRTDLNGTIEMLTDGKHVWLRQNRPSD
ncbi:DNA internalization-related competence protein ComEC/Rec2 [Dehalogenimonas lykanthroporepellens BL-DC-9]|nr:DNA internalization-related competence protein ComEC/Rec2 [Dehalogenimonas lykanthroporepellens BL-DC-9]